MGKKKKISWWQPFEKAVLPAPDREMIKELIVQSGRGTGSEEEIDLVVKDSQTDEVWMNNIYQVNIKRIENPQDSKNLIHLSIKRRDKKASRDWRHFQRIKNELIGEEYEAVELYPAESRLIDTANQYHLWVVDDKAFKWPFGYDAGRLVMNESTGNAVQRSRDDG